MKTRSLIHIEQLFVVMMLTVLITVAGCASVPAPGQSPTPPLPPASRQSIVVTLSALNGHFDRSMIAVPTRTLVTVIFSNEDSITHNLAIYSSENATDAIFRGGPANGNEAVNYYFTAPAVPGTYFFRCDIHPGNMNGRLVVTGSDCA